MAITYKSQGAGVSTETSAAALSPLCPATVDANDILIAHVFWEGTATAPSTPSGWDVLGSSPYVIETTIARHWVFGKIAAGTEDGAAVAFGSPAVTTQRAARIYSFAGYSSGTILKVCRGFAHLSHATDPAMPTVTTTKTGSLAVALVAQNDDNAHASATGESGGDWTETVAEYTVALTPGLTISIQTCTPTGNPGTVSGGSISTTNDPCGVIGFEIRDTELIFSGAAALTFGNLESTGAATFTPLTYSGAAALTFGNVELTGAATATAPTFSGAAALTFGNVELAGAGTVINPTYSGAAALTFGNIELTGAATAGPPTATGAAALTFGNLELTATGATSTPPIFSGSAALTFGNVELTGAGTHVAPAFSAAAALEFGRIELNGEATFSQVTTYAAAGALEFSGLTLSGTAAFSQGYSATGGLEFAGVTLNGSATFVAGPPSMEVIGAPWTQTAITSGQEFDPNFNWMWNRPGSNLPMDPAPVGSSIARAEPQTRTYAQANQGRFDPNFNLIGNRAAVIGIEE